MGLLLSVCRVSSDNGGDQSRAVQQPVQRPVDGQRPAQSVKPKQGKSESPAGHLRRAYSPHDQSLHQLVQSGGSQLPLREDAAAAPALHQQHRQASSLDSGVGHDQQPLQQLRQQRSGNPFATDDIAAGMGRKDMLTSSLSSQITSGNPFRSIAAVRTSSTGQARADEGQDSGQSQQTQAPVSWGLGDSPTASIGLMKDAEMSPLQNGLIRSVGFQ